jgi:hypothetical protein
MMINAPWSAELPTAPHAGKGRLATVVMGNTSMFSLIQWQQDIFGLLKEVQVYVLEIKSLS